MATTIGLLVWVCAAPPVRAQGIALQSGDVSGNAATGTNPLTWSHTVRAGNDLYLVVGVASQGSNNDVTSVTYGSDSLASLGTAEEQGMGFNGRVQLFGLDLNDLGSDRTDTVTVTFESTTASAAGGMAFSGVGSVGSVTSTQGSDAAPTISNIAGANTGDLLVDIEAHNDKAVTASANGGQSPPQTERWDRAVGGETSGGGRASQSIRGGVGGTSNSMNWTLSGGRRWVIAGVYLKPTYVTAIRLESFAAFGNGAKVRLDWRTGFEVDNLGFYLYRQQGGHRERITPRPILGSGLAFGRGLNLLAGRQYTWFDRQGGQNQPAQYWLEEIALSGASRWHGPIVAQKTWQGRGGTPNPFPAPLLEIDRQPGQREMLAPHEHVPAPRAAGPRRFDAPQSPPVDRFKIQVSKTGVYRVGRAELVAAGLPEDTDLRRLRLTREGAEVATQADETGITFFGTGSDTPWSDTGIYWLMLGQEPGLRMSRTGSQAPPSGETSFPEQAEWRERSLYLPVLHNGDAENFFGPVIGPKEAQTSLQVEAPEPTAEMNLEVTIQGVSHGEHWIQVLLNGAPMGDVRMRDRALGRLETRLAGALVRGGENQLTLIPLGGPADLSVLDRVQLGYARRLLAKEDHLRFSAPSGRSSAIGGFTTPDVRVFDVTDLLAPIELEVAATPHGDGYRAVVSVPAAEGRRMLFAFTASGIQAPHSLAADAPTDLAKPQAGADLLIVGHRAFLPALGPLQTLRTAEGRTVAVVDIQDVYDDFAHGQKTPYALRALIEAARTSWSRAPRFVLLVGDATWDPRDHLGRGNFDFVPTKMVATRLLETASDDWFVTPPGAAVPDIAIGRLPVRSPEEAKRVVAKIVAFGQGQGRERSLLQYSDHAAELDFESGADEILAPVTPSWSIQHLRRREAGAQTRDRLMEALGRGPLFVNYLGHGSEAQWAGAVLTSGDMTNLSNLDRPWVVLSMTCLTGGYHDVFTTTLSESLLLAERSGALAVWGSSTLTAPADQIALSRGFLQAMLVEGTTLGEAVLTAKGQVQDEDVRRSWILLGDPSVQFTQTVEPATPGTADPSVDAPPGPADPAEPGVARSSAGCSCRAAGAAPAQRLSAGGSTGLFLVLLLARSRLRGRGRCRPEHRP